MWQAMCQSEVTSMQEIKFDIEESGNLLAAF